MIGCRASGEHPVVAVRPVEIAVGVGVGPGPAPVEQRVVADRVEPEDPGRRRAIDRPGQRARAVEGSLDERVGVDDDVGPPRDQGVGGREEVGLGVVVDEEIPGLRRRAEGPLPVRELPHRGRLHRRHGRADRAPAGHRRPLQQLHRGAVRRHRPDGARRRPGGRRGDPLVQLGGQLRAAPLERRVGRRRRRRGPRLAERRQLDVPPLARASRSRSRCRGRRRRAARRPTSTCRSSAGRRTAAGPRWRRSADRQSAGLPTAERITGYAPPADGEYRLRVVRVSGPPPEGPLTLFSREIPLAAIGGLPESSVPTPGDAAGAIAIGAVNWRGNARKSYSSQGPTDDGRLKPDLVAPTDTRLMGPNGLRAIGGTSNAAPNAAGAAAVMLAAARRAGQAPTAAEVRGSARARSRSTSARPGRTRCSASAACGSTWTRRGWAAYPGAARLGARPGDRRFTGAVALEGHPVDAGRRRPPGVRARADLPARDHHRHPAARRRLPRPPAGARTTRATSGRSTGR